VPDKRPSRAASIRKALHRARARGLGEIASLSRTRIVEGLHSEDVLLFFAREAAGSVAPERTELTFRKASIEDGELFARDIGTETADTFVRRLGETTMCFLVMEGDRALHSSWVTKSAAWTRELRAYVSPRPGDAYVYESFTRAEARGRGIYPFALQSILADLASSGTERVWVAAEADNPPSIRAITKAGFEEAFKISYRRTLGLLKVSAPVGALAAIGEGMVTKRPVD
jgi:hypothetical protein